VAGQLTRDRELLASFDYEYGAGGLLDSSTENTGGKTVSGGYTCFASPEDAVETVAKNIEKMVAKGVRTPAQAISWKCGSSCAGHDAAGVRKWIADVGVNFYKINS